MSPADGAQKDADKKYSAPALEKGLDILELLGSKSNTLSKSQIAKELGRSTSEVFRMLGCLEERGYISERAPGDGYGLTMRLHDLVNKWPPHARLVSAALPEMRLLAEQTLQSCHLGVLNSGKLYVAAQAESPLPISLTFRIGSEFPLLRTASGRVLLAFQSKKVAEFLIGSVAPELSSGEKSELMNHLETIRANGIEVSDSDRVEGLTDFSCPVLDAQGNASAAITVPFLRFLNRNTDAESVRRKLKKAGNTISARFGGEAS
nr:IclR family transcriptional regulator [uncultured Roseibium sp.]